MRLFSLLMISDLASVPLPEPEGDADVVAAASPVVAATPVVAASAEVVAGARQQSRLAAVDCSGGEVFASSVLTSLESLPFSTSPLALLSASTGAAGAGTQLIPS